MKIELLDYSFAEDDDQDGFGEMSSYVNGSGFGGGCSRCHGRLDGSGFGDGRGWNWGTCCGTGTGEA